MFYDVVVVVQRTSKKCTKKRDARAKLLFCACFFRGCLRGEEDPSCTIPKNLVIWASPSHTTLAPFGLGLQGVLTSLGFWEWGCPFH